MTQEHPITPPPDLLKHWEDQHFDEGENYDVMLIQAYQAGADQELEACCKCINDLAHGADVILADLRAARRPKPLSLKEQALAALNVIEDKMLGPTTEEKLIRKALEALPND